jgi:hypothetical protein
VSGSTNHKISERAFLKKTWNMWRNTRISNEEKEKNNEQLLQLFP